MSDLPHGIVHKHIEPTLVVFERFNLKERSEILPKIAGLAALLPQENIAGEPYCILQYFSSYTEGYEAEVGFPVHLVVDSQGLQIKIWPALEVLALIHTGSPEELKNTRKILHQFTSEKGLVSDEFIREVYPDWRNPHGAIEAQFVIHNWNALLAQNLERVLGSESRADILQGVEDIGINTSLAERFEWTKAAMGRLSAATDENQRFDIITSCAHVFPPGLLDKLKVAYQTARANGSDPLQAVDAVLDFMKTDPGWGEKGQYRQGRVIYHTKNPADPQAHELAKTPEEKRAAYCFCPIIRANLAKGMPVSYCYCGSGWFRQQWQAATGRPVTVEVLQSVLRGDDVCQFAVHLPEDL
jgi:effector-binding domain-containing protein